MNKKLEKYLLELIIPVFLGFSLAYLITGFIMYKLPSSIRTIPLKSSGNLGSTENIKIIAQTILKNDIFGIERGIKQRIKRKRVVRVVSNINGYKLIGFISGPNPMALFKKPGKPVAIVTRKKGIDNIWILAKITKNGVYLKNKLTKEEKKFNFPVSVANISLFGKNIKVKYKTIREANSSIEKITISKSIVRRISNINTLLNQINIVPMFKNGKAIGYKINYISPTSVLRKIGLRNGDIIVSINGEPTTSPAKIMNLYSQLNQMTSVSLNIIRNGVKKTIFVNIK